MESFLAFLNRFGVVPPQDALVLQGYARIGTLQAGDFFLKPGQICRQVGFVTEGVFRVYVQYDDGKEITRGFPAEGNFMIDLESFNNQKPSIEYWEAMSVVTYIYWDLQDILRMEHELSCWHAILIPMSQHILLSESHERTEMFNDDATLRYSKFLARYPRVVARVPLRYIANFLGIAPQSLSRIRQRIGKQETNKTTHK